MLERGTNPSHAVGGAVPARRSSDTGTRRHVQRVGEHTRALPMKSSGAPPRRSELDARVL